MAPPLSGVVLPLNDAVSELFVPDSGTADVVPPPTEVATVPLCELSPPPVVAGAPQAATNDTHDKERRTLTAAIISSGTILQLDLWPDGNESRGAAATTGLRRRF